MYTKFHFQNKRFLLQFLHHYTAPEQSQQISNEMATLTVQPAHPVNFDDEMMALALQLEEINCQPTMKKGKYKADNPPDAEVAFAAFQKDIEAHMQFLKDLDFAHSIARAVDADAQAIAEFIQDEGQDARDRCLALQLSGQDSSEDVAPPPYDASASARSGNVCFPRPFH